MIRALFLFIGCLSVSCAHRTATEKPLHTAETVLENVAPHEEVFFDPLEPLNRGIFYFNAKFDRYIHMPIVEAYRYVTTAFFRERVTSVYDNLEEPFFSANALLQGKPKQAGRSALRFLINSTVGLAGMFDVAYHEEGIPRHEEDFGQTLAVYGVGEGPFLVLPILGPSNLRDTAGLVAETAVFMAVDPFNFEDNTELAMAYYGLKFIDRRSVINYRYYQTGSAFEYNMVRYLYTQKRRLDVKH